MIPKLAFLLLGLIQRCGSSQLSNPDVSELQAVISPQSILRVDLNPLVCDPIESLVGNIVVGPLPDICIPSPTSSTAEVFCIKELKCDHFMLKDITSDYHILDTLHVGLEDVVMSCLGEWVMSTLTFITKTDNMIEKTQSGQLTLSLANISVSADVEFLPSATSPAMPNRLHLKECSTEDGSVEDLRFYGAGAMAHFLDTEVAPVVMEEIEEMLPWLICDIAGPLLTSKVTSVFQDMIEPARSKIIALSSPPALVNMPGSISWNETFLGTIHKVTNALKLNNGNLLQCMIHRTNIDEVLASFDWDSLMLAHIAYLSGDINIKLRNFSIPLGGYNVEIESVSIKGLRSIENVTLLEPLLGSNVELRTSAAFSSIDLRLMTKVSHHSAVGGSCSYSQEAIIDIHLGNVLSTLDLVVAFDKTMLGSIYGDQILNIPCLLTALEDVFISSLVMDADIQHIKLKLSPFQSASGLEYDAAKAVNDFASMLIGGYSSMMSAMLKGLFQGPVKSSINEAIFDARRSRATLSGSSCSPHGNYSGVDWLEWANSTLIKDIDMLLNGLLGDEGLNNMIDCLTNDTGAVTVVVPATSPVFPGFSVTLSGLDSFTDFEVIYPIVSKPYDLGTSIIFGSCVANDESCNPLSLQFGGTAANGKPVSFAFTLTGLQLYADMIMEIDMNTLRNMNADVLSQDGCALSGVDLWEIVDLSINIDSADILLLNTSQRVNITRGVSKLINGILLPKLTSSLNSKFRSAVSSADAVCSDGSMTQQDKHDVWWTIENQLLFGVGGAIFTLAVIAFAAMAVKRKKLASENDNDSNVSSFSTEIDRRLLSESSGNSVMAIRADSCARQTSSFLTHVLNYWCGSEGGEELEYDAYIVHSGIPLYARIVLPLALLADIGLFTWSNSILLATINGTIKIGGQEDIELGALFDFSFSETVRDMWDAKVYILAVLLVFSSGFWPYFKLFLTFLAFVLPSRVMSLPMRDSILLFYDSFGKYSLVDIFLMVLLMVAFHFDLFIVSGVELVAFVVPEWGFYSFLLATMLNLLLGHWAVYLHRSVSESNPPSRSRDVTSASVMNHCFKMDLCIPQVLPDESRDDYERKGPTTVGIFSNPSDCLLSEHKVEFTLAGKVFVACTLLGCISTVIIGCYEETFLFHFKGLVGYLLGSDAIAPYSVIDIGWLLPSDSDAPNSIGIRWIQVAFFFYAVVAPLLFLAVLLFLWIVPLRMRSQKRGIVLMEVICAWSGLDVFVLALVVSLFEISRFVKFIIGDSCDQLNKILKEYRDDELHGDDKCFDVITELKKDAWLLYVSAIWLLLASFVMLHIIRAAFAQRLDGYCKYEGNYRHSKGKESLVDSSVDFLHNIRSTSMSSVGYADNFPNASSIHDENLDDYQEPYVPLLSRQAMCDAALLVKEQVGTKYSLTKTIVIMLFCKCGILRCSPE